MADFKTYKAEKRVYFVLSILAFFGPCVISIAAFFPFFDYSAGYKIAIGCIIVLLHTAVFAGGVWGAVRAHYPMLSPLPFLICLLYMFFSMDFFQKFVEPLIIIELITACGMILSAVFWGKYHKYKRHSGSMEAVLESGIIKG